MLDIEELLKRDIVYVLSSINQEVVDKIIDKIIESEVLVKKGSNVIIEPMMYNDEEYGTCFTITCLFDEESPYYDVSIELCKDCLIIHYRKKDEKYCTTIHNEKGDFLLHKDFAKKLYDYVEENKGIIFNKVV
ncbi:MAG: hypothetical protein J6R59_00195 [Paludibacteraceae bacterium]|nr:hypothetical protein [Paludibacteraceae bacterium]